MWNISDTSRLKVSNVLLNGSDPFVSCTNSNWHGPIGRWWNGAGCDYYGKYGFGAWSQWTVNQFRNFGVFRLLVGGDGDLKTLEEARYIPNIRDHETGIGTTVSSMPGLDGGSPFDQVNAQGYQMPFDVAYTASDITYASAVGENDILVSLNKYVDNQGVFNMAVSGVVRAFGHGLAGYFKSPGKMNGVWTHAWTEEGKDLKFALSRLHPGFAVPPLRMKWGAYLDNYMDEAAVSLFANARHAANKKVGLLSIIRSTTSIGGDGRDSIFNDASFGVGVRSLNTFELTELV